MSYNKQKIAVVGMSFRFPGQVDSNQKLWSALKDKQDLITEVDNDRWDTRFLKHSRKNEPGKSYIFAAGQLDRIKEFDAQFFGISPREAAQMDPQQRILLELTWEALENAAINPESLEGTKCSVYVGIASNDYAWRRFDDLSSSDGYSMTGSTASIASNRISYIFNLNGPSVSVDTACSSSLVALHQACNSIWNGEASSAIVGGVNMLLHPFAFVGFSKASMLSPTGRCRAFDEAGDGYVRSEGCAVFYLKPLAQAEQDGDRIHAVIANTGVNSDGRTNGITMPSFKGQSALLEKVYQEAGINVNDIDYIEAHGTGTAVGDPIEATAIGETLAKHRAHKHVLPIGSVKTNLGHMETASGMAGLSKAILALKHREIPSNIHFKNPNPNIDFDRLNIRVVDEHLRFPESEKPLVIGINSFGFGGTNSHVILEEYKPEKLKIDKIPEELPLPPLFLSGSNTPALKALAEQYADYLRENSAWYYDVAYQLAHKHAHLAEGIAVKGHSVSEVIRSLRSFIDTPDESSAIAQSLVEKNTDPAFIYSGNGSQWYGMGKDLYGKDPVFTRSLKVVDSLFIDLTGQSILEELFPAEEKQESKLHLTEIAQPALFAIQVAITEWLADKGILPKAVAGHSVGEVSAAWAAGALSIKQAVKVIIERSSAQALTRGTGRMAALGCSEEDTQALLNELDLASQLEIAGINSPRSVTIAGTLPALETLEKSAEERSLFCRILDLDYAFHSRFMDPIEQRIHTSLESLRPAETNIPMYSTVTGEKIDGLQLTAQYWWENVRKPVAFGNALHQMIEDDFRVFMDIGPHPIMRGYINECLRAQNIKGIACPTLKRQSTPDKDLLEAMLRAHMAGAYLDLSKHFPVQGRHIDLPPYPWQREEYWYELTEEGYNLSGRRVEHPLLGYRIKPGYPEWQNHLDSEFVEYLADHVVGNGEVMPAAGYAEMALAASNLFYGYNRHEIEDLEIRAPLLFEADQLRSTRFILNEQSGHFAIKSRLRHSDDPWTEHAVGRIIETASNENTYHLDVSEKPTGKNINAIEHYESANNIGLCYGHTFQAVENIWLDGNEAIARINTPKGIEKEIGLHQLHPSFLDSGFQILVDLIKSTQSSSSKRAMLPVRIGNLLVEKQQAEVSWIKAKVIIQSPRSLVANFELYDTSGELIALATGCRFRAVKFIQEKQETSLYEYHQLLKANVASPRRPISDIKNIVNSVRERLETKEEIRRRHLLYREISPLIDTLIACYAHELFASIASPDNKIIYDDLFSKQDFEPRQQYLIKRFLNILEEEKWAELIGKNQYQLLGSEQIPESHMLWLTLLGDYPGLMPELLSVGRLGNKLREILTGRIDTQSIIENSSLQDHLADTALTVKGTNNSTIGLISNWVQNQGAHHFRVLHLGGSEGRLSSQVVQKLPEHCDYIYVSSDETACNKVESRLEDYSNSRVSHLNLESSQEWSDFLKEESAFDLVILNGSLHTHTHPNHLLTDLSSIMNQDAFLLCIEKAPSRLDDLKMGLDDDWWHRTTDLDKPISLQLPASSWRKLIKSAAFDDITIIHDNPEKRSGTYIIAARNTSSHEEPTSNQTMGSFKADNSWLIVADKLESHQAFIDTLKAELNHLGKNIQLQLIEPHKIPAMGSLTETNKVIFLSNCDLEDPNKEDILCTQNDTLLSLVNHIYETQPEDEINERRIELILITQGGNTSFGKAFKEETDLVSSSIWGLGRVIRNEYPELNCKQIDLQTRQPLRVIPQLINELLVPANTTKSHNDREIILGETPEERRILEMRPTSVQDKNQDNAIWQGEIKLDFTDPGLLKNLTWVPVQETPVLQSEQIIVRPHASGLNFRDVMYAMGLLSDEAVESGFSGPTLGMEFAGEVTAIGKNVSDYKIGDAVMGFGPACFSTQVITNSSAVAPIPDNWLYEEAATIPTTFFTAYYALQHLAQVQPGERVLIHGGAGGVGIAAIQLAHYLGAEVFVSAGTDEKRDFVHFMGADHILDSRSLSFASEIMERTNGEGIDVVLNSLAGEAINKNLNILRPFGRFLELGKRDFYENSQIGLRPFRNNISYFGIDADQLMVERPALASTLFKNLMAIFAEGALRPLPYRCFNATRVEEAFRYMQQARQIGKILITFEELPKVPSPVTNDPDQNDVNKLDLDSDGCYLVTGGLSGFGLETARWLVQKGAKHLVLISRSGKPPEASLKAFEELSMMDISLHTFAIDITDKSKLTALFTKFGHQLPKLSGLIHAATVFEDGLLRSMDSEQMNAVLRPKAGGGWYLHELTKELNLDFFVVYSSVTTFFGNPGQGNYVAANSALEGLTKYRQQLELPALFIAWGAISDAGFLARNTEVKDALQARLGGSSLTSKEALQMLEKLLVSKHQGAAVMDINWSSMKRYLPISNSNQYRLLNWMAAKQGDDQDGGEDIREQLKELASEDALVKVAELLAREIGQILRIPADKIDLQTSVFDLGMDSLMGVELAMAIEKRFDVTMPAMALSEGPSILRLSERILQKILGTQQEGNLQTESDISDDVKRLASVHNEDLPEEQLSQLSQKLHSDKNPGRI